MFTLEKNTFKNCWHDDIFLHLHKSKLCWKPSLWQLHLHKSSTVTLLTDSNSRPEPYQLWVDKQHSHQHLSSQRKRYIKKKKKNPQGKFAVFVTFWTIAASSCHEDWYSQTKPTLNDKINQEPSDQNISKQDYLTRHSVPAFSTWHISIDTKNNHWGLIPRPTNIRTADSFLLQNRLWERCSNICLALKSPCLFFWPASLTSLPCVRGLL